MALRTPLRPLLCSIPLPEGADTEHARADFKNGELKVTVPVQRPESKRRQIPIGGAGEKSQSKWTAVTRD